MSKTHAAANPVSTRLDRGLSSGSPRVQRAGVADCCSILVHSRCWGAVGRVKAMVLFAAALLAVAVQACPVPAWPIETIGPDVWLVRGAVGDATSDNRGRTSNLMVVRHERRVWLVGSGPSPASARALDCQLRRDFGLRVTDVIAPWARPELVLGQRAWPRATRWAHADIRRSMQKRCAACVPALRARIGDAAADLGTADPVLLPERLLQGDHGELGPFRWWRLRRGDEHSVTLWRLRDRPLWLAHGLLWSDGPPDAREADVATLADSIERLQRLVMADGPGARCVPEQGGLLDPLAVAAQLSYWRNLRAAAAQATRRGEVEGSPPAPGLAGPAAWESHPRHALNWQRVMRQTADALLNAPR